jgi:DNA-binding XRE family transcriptional regulator
MLLDSVKLRKFRDVLKLSQSEFADCIDVSQATICEWEKKDTDVKLEHFVKMIEVFGPEANELSKNTSSININNQNNNKIGNNTIVGFDVKVDAYQLQKEHIETLKETNEFMKEEVRLLISKFSELITVIKSK